MKRYDAMRTGFKRKAVANVVLCLAFTVLLGVIIDNSTEFYVDDYQSFFVPGCMEIGRSLDAGEYPFMSPYSWAGGALAGGYQFAVFNASQLGIIYGLYKLGLGAVSFAKYYTLAYFFILCLGIAVLSECYRLSLESKILAISIGAMNYFIVYWSGYDWTGGLSSFSWLPWCWAGLQRIISEKKIRWIGLSAVTIYFVLSAGYPFTVGMLALVTLWLSIRCLWERERILVVARMALSWLLGLGLAMPALLLFIEYYLHTARSVEAGGISNVWSVPPEAFWGLINPLYVSLWNIWGLVRRHYSFELFCGVVPPVALLVLAFSTVLRKRVRLGFELLFLAFVVALMILPSGTASYRWSFRWMPLYGLIMAIVAAKTFDYLETKQQDPYVVTIFGGQVSAIMLCAFGSAAVFAYQYLIMGYGGVTEDRGLYAIGVMAGFFLWAYVSSRRKKYNKVVRLIPVFVTIASFGLINVIPLNPSILAKWHALDDLQNVKLGFSDNIRYMNLFTRDDFFLQDSADTILPGNTPMLVKVHCVTGYSAMMLGTFFQLFGFEYSSFMKPADLDATCKHAFATGGMFDLLGIDGVVLGFSQRERAGQAVKEGWNVVSEGPGGVILHRARRNDMHIESALLATYEKSDADVVRALREKSDGARRHVLLDADGGQPSRDAAFAPVSIEHLVAKRNSVAVDIANASQEAPGLIVFKRAWYPGYRVFFNDRELPLVHADMLLPAVVIPPGQSGRLLLDYAPQSLRIGLIVAGCSLLALLGLVAYGMKSRASHVA